MSKMENPYINFHSFFNNLSYYGLEEEEVHFKLSNGNEEIIIHTDKNGLVTPGQWNFHNYSVKDSIELTETMQFSVQANGAFGFILLESGLDVFQVTDSATVSVTTNSVLVDDEIEGEVLLASIANEFNIAENDTVDCENAPYYLLSYNSDVFKNIEIEAGILSFDIADPSKPGNYKIIYGVNCGGLDNQLATVSVTVSEIISVENITQNNFQLSPNPAKEFVFVDGLQQQSTSQIAYQLYKINGQLIESKNLAKSSIINLQHLNNGIYIVKFYANDKIISVNKIIKE